MLHYHDRICFSFQHKVSYFVWYSPNYTGSHLVSICLIQHFSSFDLSYLFSYVDMSLVNSMLLHLKKIQPNNLFISSGTCALFDFIRIVLCGLNIIFHSLASIVIVCSVFPFPFYPSPLHFGWVNFHKNYYIWPLLVLALYIIFLLIQ